MNPDDRARSSLPLRRLMQQYGHDPDSRDCPFCGVKASSPLVKNFRGIDLFRCWRSTCRVGQASMHEVKYIAAWEGCDEKEARRRWYRMAGLPETHRSMPVSLLNKGTRRVRQAPDPDRFYDPEIDDLPAAPPTTESSSGSEPSAGDPDAGSMGAGPEGSSPEVTAVESAPPGANPTDDGSEGGQPPGGAAAPEGDDDGDPVPKILHWFWERLELTEDDAHRLWEKRGLTRQTLEAMGVRSNLRANEAILRGMESEFGVLALLESGLWVKSRTGLAEPNKQFYGWGPSKLGRDGDWDYGWTHQPIIPYFDHEGRVVHMRPHKGMIRGRPPQLYVVRQAGKADIRPAETAIVTEGEFKAMAIYQAIGNQKHRQTHELLYTVGAVPGISTTKRSGGGWWVRDAMDTWLQTRSVKRVVVAFDNEEKGDPSLPSFKAEEWKRHDTQVWARYLAEDVARQGYEGAVAVLPNEWRDAAGKADWDGALRRLINDHGGDWPAACRAVAVAFHEVVRNARPAREVRQLGLFDEAAERVIYRKLKVIQHEPLMPEGQEREQGYAVKLGKFLHRARRSKLCPLPVLDQLGMLAAKYREVGGRYYVLHPPKRKGAYSPERDATGPWLEAWLERKGYATDPEYRWACDLMIKGVPEPISNFYIRPHYLLERENGELVRLVQVCNVHHEETPLLQLDAESFASPKAMRVWLNRQSNVAFRAGERELQAIQEDMSAAMAHRRVHEVPYFGYHEPSGIWFFNDVAYTPDGREILPAKTTGVFWHLGVGYKVGDRDQEGQLFSQGRPTMRPGVEVPADQEIELAQNLAASMFDTLGGPEGWMLLGQLWSYAFAPEIFRKWDGFPGLWIHGESRQGKTSVAIWMMRMWGFVNVKGIELKGSTPVGVSIAMQQYSNLPLWLEEFQQDADVALVEKIKGAFNRQAGIKWKREGEDARLIRTAPLVTGVATSTDAQIRSRYVHSQVSAAKRQANRFEWFQENADNFYVLGRRLLRERHRLAPQVMEALANWVDGKDAAESEVRSRIVYGVPWAVFSVVCEAWGLMPKSKLRVFREYMILQTKNQSSHVVEQLSVNQFWHLVVEAYRAGVFGETKYELQRFFRVRKHPAAVPPGVVPEGPDDMHVQLGWAEYKLMILPAPVISHLNRYLVQQRKPVVLNQGDLHAQMAQRPYFLGNTKYRFGKDRSGLYCWKIDVSTHELGYQPVTRDELIESLRKNEHEIYSVHRIRKGEEPGYVDPRKGDLFALVHAAEDEETEATPMMT